MIDTSSVPQLIGSINYHEWHDALLILLSQHALRPAITRDLSTSTNPAEATMNLQAVGAIYFSLDPLLRYGRFDIDNLNAYKVWQSLEAKYKPKACDRIGPGHSSPQLDRLISLYRLVYGPRGRIPDEHPIIEFGKVITAYEEIQATPPHDMKIVAMLACLGEGWESVRAALWERRASADDIYDVVCFEFEEREKERRREVERRETERRRVAENVFCSFHRSARHGDSECRAQLMGEKEKKMGEVEKQKRRERRAKKGAREQKTPTEGVAVAYAVSAFVVG